MKFSFKNTISAVVLWFCMLITLFLSIRLFYVNFTQFVDKESAEVSALLTWVFLLLIITFFCSLIFSFFSCIRKWKENPKKAGHSIIGSIILGVLLLIIWKLGSGNPLLLTGYKGNENTYLWLKLTDMCLYSVYILLGLGFIAMFGGIIWSFFKKID